MKAVERRRNSRQTSDEVSQGSDDGIQPALVPYSQLCWLSNEATSKRAKSSVPKHCRHTHVTNRAFSSDDLLDFADLAHTTPAAGKEDDEPLAESDAGVTSGIENSCSVDGKSASSPVTSHDDVRCSSSSSKETHPTTATTPPNSNGELRAPLVNAVTISGHTQPITSCQLVGSSLIMTSSLDGTVRLWKRSGEHLTSLDCSSPVHRAASIRNVDDSSNRWVVLAATESGHLLVWNVTAVQDADSGESLEVRRRSWTSVHVPNPVTAMVVSSDLHHLVTACCYSAFDFVQTKSTTSSNCRLGRRARGTVKAWAAAPLLADHSDVDLKVMCSRTAHQLTSSVTSEQDGGCGVTCLALTEDGLMLAVGLSSTPPDTSSSSSSSAVVIVCNRDKMEPLWVTDDVTSTYIHAAVFVCQPSTWSLFVTTDTTVELLKVIDKSPTKMRGEKKLCSSVIHRLITPPASYSSFRPSSSVQLSSDGGLLAACVGHTSALLDVTSGQMLLLVQDVHPCASDGAGQTTSHGRNRTVHSHQQLFVAGPDASSVCRGSSETLRSHRGEVADDVVAAAPFVYVLGNS